MAKAKIALLHLKHNIIYYLIAVIGVTAFFAHENFSFNTQETNNAKNNWLTSKQLRTKALENVKNLTKGSAEYDAYWTEKLNTDIAYNNYLEVLDKERFLGFKNMQQFMGEFGWALGLFIYSLFNLIITFINKPEQTMFGKIIMHSTYITIAIFYLRWCFNRVDYLSSKYVLFNLATVSMILVSTFILVRHKKKLYKKMKKALEVMSRYLVFGINIHIKPESIKDHKKDLDNVFKEGMKYE